MFGGGGGGVEGAGQDFMRLVASERERGRKGRREERVPLPQLLDDRFLIYRITFCEGEGGGKKVIALLVGYGRRTTFFDRPQDRDRKQQAFSGATAFSYNIAAWFKEAIFGWAGCMAGHATLFIESRRNVGKKISYIRQLCFCLFGYFTRESPS